MVLRGVGVFSVAKMFGVGYGLLGLLMGCVFTLLALVGMTVGVSGDPSAAILGLVFGVGAVLILPITYGVFGFVAGIIGACIFNLVAGIVGGVELQIEKR